MGLADLGIGSEGPYAYQTPSVAANLTLNSFSAYTPGYGPWLDAPDWVTLSLAAVAVGLPINGSQNSTPDGTFWAENAVRFNGTELQFEDNVWNFSAPGASLNSATLENQTPLRSTTPGGLLSETYYQHWGPTYSITYPFTLSLINTLALVAGRPVLEFNYTLSSRFAFGQGTYDRVAFARTLAPGPYPEFEVNGSGRNPFGLPDDVELVFAGDGSGSNADLTTLNGTAHLRYWDIDQYVPTPSAYDYGEDSGGTSEGIAAYYLGTTEYLNAGPSFLDGLWNTTNSPLGPAASPGWVQIHVALQPAFGLLLATNQTAEAATSSGNFSFVPTDVSGNVTTDLPPPPSDDGYVFEAWAVGFDPSSVVVTGNSSGNVSLNLTADPNSADAPLYLNGDAQVSAYGATGGTGVTYTPETRTLAIRDRTLSLSAPFRELNDYLDPTFILFAAQNLTNSSVQLEAVVQDPGSFQFTWYGAVDDLPNLTQGYSFANVRGNSSVSGVAVAYPGNLPYAIGVGFDSPTVEFYDTDGGDATNVSALETTAVTVEDSTGFRASQVSAEAGIGVEYYGVTGSSASNLTDYSGVGAFVVDSDSVELSSLLPLFQGTAVAAEDSQDLLVDRVTVDNTTGIVGLDLANVTLEYWNLSGIQPPTFASLMYSGHGLFVRDIHSTTLGGFAVYNWTGVRGWNLSANGFKSDVFEDVGQCENLSFWNVSADQGANTMDGFVGDTDIHFYGLTAVAANAVEGLTLSTDITAENISATSLGNGFEGGMSDTDLSFFNVYSATGGEGVGGTNLTGVQFSNGTSDSASLSLILLESQAVSVRDVRALNGSVAVSLAESNGVNASDLLATGRSVALSWWTGTGGQVTNLTATNESMDAQLVGLTGVEATELSDVNSTPGRTYFENPFLGIVYPVAPLQTYADQGLTVDGVVAVNCSFAEEDVYSDGLTLLDIRSWGGGTALQLNGTEFASIDGLFSESNLHGLVLQSTLNVTLAGSTIEDSVGVGIYLLAGLNDTFYANNFVASDGSSAYGTYDPAHVQASVYLTQDVNFTFEGIGNYWSDWSSRTPYPVAAGISDSAPAPAFLSSWLNVVAGGLTSGVAWTVSVDDRSYVSEAPLVVIPSTVLPSGNFTYVVSPPSGWAAAPRSGTGNYVGTNQTVTIEFTLPEYRLDFVETGLPAGTAWNLSVAGVPKGLVASAGPGAISFEEPNGTYPVAVVGVPGYTESVIAPGSEVTVYGAYLTVAVRYQEVVYALTFEESNLPHGTSWGVTLGGTFHGSNGSVVAWNASNGTYAYNLSGVPGWHEDSLPYHGTVTVSNRSQVVQLVWFPERYSVTFASFGLPAGTSWTVVFAGENLTLITPTVAFDLPNGTYEFRVFATLPTTLSGTPASGSLIVAGGNVAVNVTFSTAAVVPTPPSSLGPWEFVGVGVVAVVAVLATALWLRRPRSLPEDGELMGEDLTLPPPPAGPREP